MVAEVGQLNHSNNKCYALDFIYIYIYICQIFSSSPLIYEKLLCTLRII